MIDQTTQEVFDDFARRTGFDPDADVVPSAAGLPLETDLTPEQFRDHSKAAFRDSYVAIRDYTLADY